MTDKVAPVTLEEVHVTNLVLRRHVRGFRKGFSEIDRGQTVLSLMRHSHRN